MKTLIDFVNESLTAEQKDDKAHKLLNEFIEPLEDKLGDITHSETIHRGRNLYRYHVIFYKNKPLNKYYEVSLGNGVVSEIKKHK